MRKIKFCTYSWNIAHFGVTTKKSGVFFSPSTLAGLNLNFYLTSNMRVLAFLFNFCHNSHFMFGLLRSLPIPTSLLFCFCFCLCTCLFIYLFFFSAEEVFYSSLSYSQKQIDLQNMINFRSI